MKTIKLLLGLLFALSAIHCAGAAEDDRTATEPQSLLRRISDEISTTVSKAMPSVVVVRTEAIDYYLARDYYRGNLYRIPRALAGQGSGVIIDRAGHVLTSYHVVENADRIEVVLDDQSKYGARMIGFDRNTDIAVLSIDDSGKEFDPIEMGDSDDLHVGEIVIAAGSPFSLSGSVTMGVVSQKGRSVGLLPYEDFIQTDASINPGNSGGPLVNVEGEMVGLNAVIQTAGPMMRGNIGIGFAIPVNLARKVAEQIISSGRFRRPWIGILPSDDDGDNPRGVLLGHIFGNSPAAKAGLMPGDTILAVDETDIGDISELQRVVIASEKDAELILRVERSQEIIDVKLRPEPMPEPGTVYQGLP